MLHLPMVSVSTAICFCEGSMKDGCVFKAAVNFYEGNVRFLP
jgi:hypothetical protein